MQYKIMFFFLFFLHISWNLLELPFKPILSFAVVQWICPVLNLVLAKQSGLKANISSEVQILCSKLNISLAAYVMWKETYDQQILPWIYTQETRYNTVNGSMMTFSLSLFCP